MIPMPLQRYFLILARLVLGAIFLVSGALKIPHAMDFAHNIAAYQVLPYWANILAAATLPWIELFCGLFLIIGYKVRACSLMTTGFMLVFITAMLSAVFRGLEIDCGCFQVGQSENPTPLWLTILRDLGFLTLSAFVLWNDRRDRNDTGNASFFRA